MDKSEVAVAASSCAAEDDAFAWLDDETSAVVVAAA